MDATVAEEEARVLAEMRDRDGLTTRQIADKTGEVFDRPLSQATVVRRLQLYDSGPMPVFSGNTKHRSQKSTLPLVLIAVAMLLLVAAVGAITFLRSSQPVTIAPTVVCTKSAGKFITGLAPARSGSCDPGWRMVVLGSGN